MASPRPFFCDDPSTPDIFPLSLHDALPIWVGSTAMVGAPGSGAPRAAGGRSASRLAKQPPAALGDRKSTRLNSSHMSISYAVFCLKKKKADQTPVSADTLASSRSR